MAALVKPDQLERVAEALMAIETAMLALDAPTRRRLHQAPLLVLSPDHPPEPRLGLHTGGRSFALSLQDADLVAIALRMERAGRAHDAIADAIDAGCRLVNLMRRHRAPVAGDAGA
jgi:hypothetical protein